MSDLLSHLVASACESPEKPVLEAGNYMLTADGLAKSVDSFASVLSTHHVHRLALVAQNSLQWVIADLACRQAEVCVLTLPDYFSDMQLQFSIDCAGADAVLTDDSERLLRIVESEPIRVEANSMSGLTLHRVVAPKETLIPDSTQKITFSSGSTGEPRGVCLSSEHQLNVASSLAASSPVEKPRHLCLLPLSTLLENVGGVYCALLAGGTVIVPSTEETGFSGSSGLEILKLLDVIERHQPTSFILIPQMLVALVAALAEGWRPPDSVEFVAVGGGRVAPDLIHQARSCGLPVFEGYGLSESGSVACLNLPGQDMPGSVGKPLDHVQVSTEQGEILIRGNTFLGYLDDPESWYPEVVMTGDLGHIDENGYVYIGGRSKNVLISNFGRNINPEWIESQLVSDPSLAQCVVFGDARPWCVALIAPVDSSCTDADIQACVDHSNRQLPDYARVLGWHRLSPQLSASDGLLTSNGRPRRALIEKHYSSVIESLYCQQADRSVI